MKTIISYLAIIMAALGFVSLNSIAGQTRTSSHHLGEEFEGPEYEEVEGPEYEEAEGGELEEGGGFGEGGHWNRRT
jgi:hypothetical protein